MNRKTFQEISPERFELLEEFMAGISGARWDWKFLRHHDTRGDGRIRSKTNKSSHCEPCNGTNEGTLRNNRFFSCMLINLIRVRRRLIRILYVLVTLEFAHGNKIPRVKTPKEVPAAIAAKLFVT